MDFDELLSAAESAPVPSRTVRVCVQPSVAEKRAALLSALEDARKVDARASTSDQRLGAPVTEVTTATDAAAAALDAFDDEVQKSLVTLKFTRLDGQKWALLTSANPMRVDVALDRHYGYNYDTVTGLAARASGVRLDDDGEHVLTPEQWDRLMRVLSGHDVQAIRDAVWTLNEYEPSQHIEALVKGSAGA